MRRDLGREAASLGAGLGGGSPRTLAFSVLFATTFTLLCIILSRRLFVLLTHYQLAFRFFRPGPLGEPVRSLAPPSAKIRHLRCF